MTFCIYNISQSMNIEKIIANCLERRRSQSQNQCKNMKTNSITKKFNQCYTQNPSFQPTINQLPKSIYKPTTKTQCSREEIIQRLYTDRRSIQGRRTQQKLRQQQRQYEQNCTFQPRVNPYSKRILKTQCTDDDPFERLYTDAINKKKLSESIHLIENNKQNYSFQPETNYKGILNQETCNMKPIYERIQEIVREKREKLKQLQEEANKEQLLPQPKISEISEKIVANKEEFKKNILDRLSGYVQGKRKKKEAEEAQHVAHMMKQCTFKPEINSSVEVSTNFMIRQQQFMKKLQSKMSSRMTYNNFQPEINKISQILMREQRENETMEDKLNRLTSDINRREKIEEIEKEVYQQCTFQPEINTISKCLAAQHISHKCDHMHQKEEAYQFKPKINKISQILAKNSKVKRADSADFAEQKKQNLDKIKMQNQYEELKECTFKPKINYSKPKNNINLNDVRGFESFVKKIDKINQLKDEEKDREQKLFHLEKKYKTRKSTTPVEFKLSQGYNIKEAVKQEVREKFQKQCPFHPQITSIR